MLPLLLAASLLGACTTPSSGAGELDEQDLTEEAAASPLLTCKQTDAGTSPFKLEGDLVVDQVLGALTDVALEKYPQPKNLEPLFLTGAPLKVYRLRAKLRASGGAGPLEDYQHRFLGSPHAPNAHHAPRMAGGADGHGDSSWRDTLVGPEAGAQGWRWEPGPTRDRAVRGVIALSCDGPLPSEAQLRGASPDDDGSYYVECSGRGLIGRATILNALGDKPKLSAIERENERFFPERQVQLNLRYDGKAMTIERDGANVVITLDNGEPGSPWLSFIKLPIPRGEEPTAFNGLVTNSWDGGLTEIPCKALSID